MKKADSTSYCVVVVVTKGYPANRDMSNTYSSLLIFELDAKTYKQTLTGLREDGDLWFQSCPSVTHEVNQIPRDMNLCQGNAPAMRSFLLVFEPSG